MLFLSKLFKIILKKLNNEKNTLIAAVALLATTFTSCKKYYTCTCSINQGSNTSSTSTIYTEKMKKADAEAKCSSGNFTTPISSASCKIN